MPYRHRLHPREAPPASSYQDVHAGHARGRIHRGLCMRFFAVSAIAGLSMLGLASAETRPLADFTRVSASGGLDVEVSIGPSFAVEVTGRDAARVVTRVRNGELEIAPERQGFWHWRSREAAVHVSMPSVLGLEASSGSRLVARGLQGGSLALDASSGADLIALGACSEIEADASSGAHLDASALACERGSVDVSSGARADVNVNGRLNLDASSGGDIYASGDPEMGNISLSSGGSLHRR